MLGFGITAKVDPDAIAELFKATLPEHTEIKLAELGVSISDIIADNATFMIVLGVIAVLIAIFGFVGACCLIRWMLVVVC